MGDRLFHILFYGTLSVLYAALLFLDIRSSYVMSTYIKYVSIILCFAAALYTGINNRQPLVAVTSALTLFADTFLLLLDDHYIAGVTAFAIIQTLFGIYIEFLRNIRYIFLSRIMIYAIAVILILSVPGTDGVAIVSAWSYVNLVLNVFQLTQGLLSASNTKYKHKISAQYKKHLALLTAGMWLFLGCDTCVGLTNLSAYIPGSITGTALLTVSFLMWVFYLPSQVLIVSAFMYKPDKSCSTG